jgi:hypothetical protein
MTMNPAPRADPGRRSIAVGQVAGRPAILVVPVPRPRSGAHGDGLPAGTALNGLGRHAEIIAHMFDRRQGLECSLCGAGRFSTARLPSRTPRPARRHCLRLAAVRGSRRPAGTPARCIPRAWIARPATGYAHRSGFHSDHRIAQGCKSALGCTEASQLPAATSGISAGSTRRSQPHVNRHEIPQGCRHVIPQVGPACPVVPDGGRWCRVGSPGRSTGGAGFAGSAEEFVGSAQEPAGVAGRGPLQSPGGVADGGPVGQADDGR